MPSSSFPVIPAGTKVTSGLLGSMETLNAWKTASTSIASSTTLAVDPDLQISTTVAAGTYFMTGFLFATGVLGTGDIKVAVNYSGSFSGASVWGIHGHTTASITAFEAMGQPVGTASQPFGLNGGNFDYLFMHGYLATTSTGTLQIQWAQNTSNASATQMRTGSWIQLQQVA